MTVSGSAPGASVSATSLKAPPMSYAALSASRPIQITPKRCGSGKSEPGWICMRCSGERAMPTTRSPLRRPLITAVSRSPGRSPCASAKISLSNTSSSRPGSTRRPSRM